MAYAVYFLFMGFNTELPWDKCNHDYNTRNCYSLPNRDNCTAFSNETVFWNLTCTSIEDYCEFANETIKYDVFDKEYIPEHLNVSSYYSACKVKEDHPFLNESTAIPFANVTFRKSASEEFWYIDVLLS